MNQLVYCKNTMDKVPDKYEFQSTVINSKALKKWRHFNVGGECDCSQNRR